MSKYTIAGLICLGSAIFELADGLITGSHTVTLPAAAAFTLTAMIFLIIGDEPKEPK